jgi:hypothetical protein
VAAGLIPEFKGTVQSSWTRVNSESEIFLLIRISHASRQILIESTETPALQLNSGTGVHPALAAPVICNLNYIKFTTPIGLHARK